MQQVADEAGWGFSIIVHITAYIKKIMDKNMDYFNQTRCVR